MQILRNEVFAAHDHNRLPDGNYRILDLDAKNERLVLFRLGLLPESKKPFTVEFDEFSGWMDQNQLAFQDYMPPSRMTLEEDSLGEAQREERDRKYEQISSLVEDSSFVVRYAAQKRNTLVADRALDLGVNHKKLYRLINRFWEHGQMRNALLASFENCGAPGQMRCAGSRQLGRPLDEGTFIPRSRKSVNAGDAHRRKFEIALNWVIDETKSKKIKFTYARVYRRFKRLSPYREEIERATADNRAAQIPTMRQLDTWLTNNVGKLDIDRRILPPHVWQKDKRGLESSADINAPIPGSRYEIDSTVADVYVVADYDRHKVLGRPTIYVVIDVASRMIVGFHVSLRWASWDCARQALYNAFTDKVDFCSRHGLDIGNDEWPSVGIPAKILCDRGEMIGHKARVVAKNLGTIIQIAPPYRADVKGIVERRFGIANEDLHFVPGTTLAQLRQRGEPDYRLNSVLTLNEVTQILCSLFHLHNTQRQFDELFADGLVAQDLAPTPVNFWSFHVSENRHALKQRSKDEIIAALLPSVPASITDRGIKYKEMRFTCARASAEEWFTKARNTSRSKIEARADLSWTSDLYVRVKGEPGFLMCQMIESRRQFRDRHPDDLTYLREWKREKKEHAGSDLATIEHDERVDNIVDGASKEKAATPTNLSRAARTKHIAKNRREAISEDNSKPAADSRNRVAKTSRAVRRSLRIIKGGLDRTDDTP